MMHEQRQSLTVGHVHSEILRDMDMSYLITIVPVLENRKYGSYHGANGLT